MEVKVEKTALPGVVVIEPRVFRDSRGFFTESYNRQAFSDAGIEAEFVQDNHSLSVPAGTLRGLHFQRPPMEQAKLVRVTAGAVYDVAVDIRPGSATFGKWVGAILSAANHRQLFVPRGFAHGFCTLVPNTEVMYKVDNYYSPEHDGGILWNDPEISVEWPFTEVTLSDKDKGLPRLAEI